MLSSDYESTKTTLAQQLESTNNPITHLSHNAPSTETKRAQLTKYASSGSRDNRIDSLNNEGERYSDMPMY